LIIVDQSTNDKTKNIFNKIKNPKIKYFYSKKPSLTLARNFGIKKSSKKSKILIFLDDDVSLSKDYFDKIIEVFNKVDYAVAVSGYYLPKIKVNKFENLFRRLFLIENYGINSAKVYSPFGAQYPYKIDKIINSSWIPGFNMAYKIDAIRGQFFDENFFRYALAEDFEFSTRIHKKYPNGLFITPYAKITHRVSEIERMPKPKLVYMNQINHLYIQAKNLNGFLGIVSLGWVLFGISMLQILMCLLRPNKQNLLKTKIYFKALHYCLKRLPLIRKGTLELPNNL
jgi:GT2 family glycosyltransferase